MKQLLHNLIAVILFFYLMISIVQFICGLGGVEFVSGECNRPNTRIGIIFPAYRFGCWMGQPLEKE